MLCHAGSAQGVADGLHQAALAGRPSAESVERIIIKTMKNQYLDLPEPARASQSHPEPSGAIRSHPEPSGAIRSHPAPAGQTIRFLFVKLLNY